MSQFSNSVYDIERPTGQCAVDGQHLVAGESFIAALVEFEVAEEGQKQEQAKSKIGGDNALGLKRLDFSLEAWDKIDRPDALYCFWKTVVPEANAKKKMFVDNQVLMDILNKLEGDEKRRAFRFVLSLVLTRKRLLRFEDTKKTAGKDVEGNAIEFDWWVMTPKVNIMKGPMGKWDESKKIEILDPKLNDTQTAEVVEQMSQILDLGDD